MAKIELSIIYVNFNTAKLLAESLKSVLKHLDDVNTFDGAKSQSKRHSVLTLSAVERVNFEVIVVDNGSEGSDVDKLNKIINNHKCAFGASGRHSELDSESTNTHCNWIPASAGMTHKEKSDNTNKSITLVKSQKNLGFGAGNNLGAKQAKGDYLLFLNTDTSIVDGSLEKLLLALKNHPEIGALTPLLLHQDEKTLQRHFFGKFHSFAGITFRRWQGRSIDRSLPIVYTEMVSGAAMMIKKELFDKIGGFDQHYFMYLEDDDLCRSLVKAGFKNAVLTTAKIIHLEGQSSNDSEKKKHYYQSQNYYWRKHNGLLAMWLMRLLRWPYLLIIYVANKCKS